MNRGEKKDIKIDKVIRSKRKTVMMQITKDAQLVVRVPKYTPDLVIKIAVQKHRIWIEKKLKMMRERVEKNKNRKFEDGGEFLFLGQAYKLHYLSKDGFLKRSKKVRHKIPHQGRSLVFDGELFFLLFGVSDPKKVFENWYKKRAHEVIVPRVEKFAEKYKFSYNNIRITSAQTRWGSCSSKKNLNFSWRLIMAPKEVVDYVIVHELTHLKHMNHSREFWANVERICPLYKHYKIKLEEYNLEEF